MSNLNVLVLGSDGYLGWPVCCELIARGHNVMGIDGGFRRAHYRSMEVDRFPIHDPALLPLSSFAERKAEMSSYQKMWLADITDGSILTKALSSFSADVVVHLAEISSRAWAMSGMEQAATTFSNNASCMLKLISSIHQHKPATLIIKVGTIDAHRPVKDVCTVSLRTVSELLKVSCSVQGLRAVEVEAGLIYGYHTPATDELEMWTRFDYDVYFGSVVHRFIVQKLAGLPLTVYGSGDQKLHLIHLSDIVNHLAEIVDHAASTSGKLRVAAGSFRTYTSFTEVLSVKEIADRISSKQEILSNPRGSESRSHPADLDGACRKGRELQGVVHLDEYEVARISDAVSSDKSGIELHRLKLRDPSWRGR